MCRPHWWTRLRGAVHSASAPDRRPVGDLQPGPAAAPLRAGADADLPRGGLQRQRRRRRGLEAPVPTKKSRKLMFERSSLIRPGPSRHVARGPAVAQGLPRRAARLGIGPQQRADQRRRVLRDPLPVLRGKLEGAPEDLRQCLRVAPPAERQAPGEHEEHDHPDTPKVAGQPVPAPEHLWCDIKRRTCPCTKDVALPQAARVAEVSHLDTCVLD
mmetsp:Transcript_73583/g.207824  ORF Transcript_73583/g.207824 Transcript_73583/m.207824 type:complete len:214 (+) Transcript_73583:28-669(+)